MTVPNSLTSGQHTVVALGVDQLGVTHTLAFTVTIQPTTGSLPVTGLAMTWIVLAAVTSILTGATLTTSGRRRC
ncbi:hypothetical protein AB0K00_34220 [Dactylosporangium sp. NPDC049525]|uniref:hypothetical protein n=1 Tax=Dactylosporangium sp. NPDC049525 TaxID=3154730 RepID=UPI003419DE44